MKVSIFAFAVNDKFPIDIAHRHYQRYLKDDWEYVLFNDAADPKMEAAIDAIARRNLVRSVRVPQSIHTFGHAGIFRRRRLINPSEAFANTVNWAVREYATEAGLETVVLTHADVFPYCDVRVSGIVQNKLVASTVEFRCVDGAEWCYLYPALTMINMKALKDPAELDFSVEPGLDVGGRTKDFLRKHASSVRVLTRQLVRDLVGEPAFSPFLEYFAADLAICGEHHIDAGWLCEGFYHYGAGSQWNATNPAAVKGHKKRMDLFVNYFADAV